MNNLAAQVTPLDDDKQRCIQSTVTYFDPSSEDYARCVRTVLKRDPLFLLADITPDFVGLHPLHAEIVQFPKCQGFAFLAHLHQQPHDRVAIQPGEPFRRADRAALNQALDGFAGRFVPKGLFCGSVKVARQDVQR